jgi:hypothetical protein
MFEKGSVIVPRSCRPAKKLNAAFVALLPRPYASRLGLQSAFYLGGWRCWVVCYHGIKSPSSQFTQVPVVAMLALRHSCKTRLAPSAAGTCDREREKEKGD